MDCISTDDTDVIWGPTSDCTGLLQPEILQIMARNQTIRHAKWTVKYDKNRDEDEDDEDEKPELKRKRPSSQSIEQTKTEIASLPGHSLMSRQSIVMHACILS